ncbi:sulfatase [Pontiellaceae bacterium B12219]|nr:sulfatase [Pontiellaceae bacterium B12219]
MRMQISTLFTLPDAVKDAWTAFEPRRRFRLPEIKRTWIVFFCLFGFAVFNTAAEKPNVLFIAVDDLNDWIGCMGGHPQAITPNIDRLAKEGMLFSNAHCQAPICGPSRASVMTGLAPATTGIYLQINDADIRNAGPAAAEAVFMPDWFEQNGYKTMGAGKIYHQGDKAETFDEFSGKSNFGPKPKKRMKWPIEGVPFGTLTDWGAFPERDDQMPDFNTAAFAVEKLKQKHDKPFFLAAGFCRPHVPWHVPQKWFDLFPVESIQMPPYKPDDMDDVPEIGKRIAEMPMMPTTEWAIEKGEWKHIVQAYLACMAFADAQVGKVLDALRESDYADNTIVVLWADHGYHIGEKNRFAKQAVWERDTHTVLIFRVPGMAAGEVCGAPVQLLDLYPTLLELCGMPENPGVEGNSLVPLLKNPESEWDHVAITSYGQGNVSMRSRTHRYIVYEDGSEELYDMIKDPNEWNNLADNPECSGIKQQFKAAVPGVQVPLSPHSTYTVNAYWRSKVSASEKESEHEN